MSLYPDYPPESVISSNIPTSQDLSTLRSIIVLRSFRSPYPLPVTPMISRSNFWGMPETIEYAESGGFNPTFLTLPSERSANGTYVVLARETDPTLFEESPAVRPRWVVACILEPENYEMHLRWTPLWDWKDWCHTVQRLELIQSEELLFPKCDPDNPLDSWFRNVQGPEDPRIFWSHMGEPLIVYNSISASNSDLCRHMYVADLRSVYPVVNEILSSDVNQSPIRFHESMPILYHNQSSFQKNWVPFTNADCDLFFHTDLIPQTIYKLNVPENSEFPTFNSDSSSLITLELAMRDSQQENCLTLVANNPLNVNARFHQSTPFLEVVLCTSEDARLGACDENDANNRVYLGLIHVRHPFNRFYERRVITLNSTFPWNYVSVSKPITYRTIPIPCRRSPG